MLNILLFLLFSAFCAVFVFKKSYWFFGRRPTTNAEKLKYVGAIIGGVLLFMNAYAYLKQVEEQNRSNNLVVKGQLDTRFKDAATLLASDITSTELSGIYALHQLAIEASQEQKGYVIVIKNILIAFIKENSVIEKDTVYNKKNVLLLQTIIDKLFRDKGCEIYTEYPIDLSRTVLKEIVFNNAQLDSANFMEAQLQGAYFMKAKLLGSSFVKAQLQYADFDDAQLQGADFYDAHLQGVYFGKAKLQGADFYNTNLQSAYFGKAQLQGANFMEAQLQGADFFSSNLQGADFTKAQLDSANFSFADKIDEAKFKNTFWNKEPDFNGTLFEREQKKN